MLISIAATPGETKKLIKKALIKQIKVRDGLYPLRNNPSVSHSYHQAEGRVEALEAVVEAQEGSLINLKMLAN